MGMILNYLGLVSVTTLKQLFLLLGPSLILGLLMHYISRLVEHAVVNLVGMKAYMYGLKIIGTPVHEMGHVVFSLIFGHHITEVQLFKPDPNTGLLGYVNRTYDPDNVYQRIGNFFIGIGPIILGSLFIYLSAWGLMRTEVFGTLDTFQMSPQSFGTAQAFGAMLNNITAIALEIFSQLFRFENLKTWQFWVFLYILVSVGTSIRLSPVDIRNAGSGFFTLVGLIFVFNLVTVWMGSFVTQVIENLSQNFSFFYGLLFFTLFLNFALGLLFLALGTILNRREQYY
jgi:hypothetical protein